MDSQQVFALIVGLFILIIVLTTAIMEAINNANQRINLIFNYKKWALIISILGVNAAGCALVYYTRNLQVILYIIVALKSKDIIMSVIFVFNMVYRLISRRYTTTVQDEFDEEIAEIQKIVAVIPAFKESEEQIRLTLNSILSSECGPHYILPVVISDGATNFSSLAQKIHLSNQFTYTSWKLKEVSLDVYFASAVDKNDPQKLHDIIFIDKSCNMGKKDTILLINDIFNYPRSNIPSTNKLIRQQILNQIRDTFGVKDFDYIFFTDGDTFVDPKSINYLRQTLLKTDAIAACGVVNVLEDKDSNFFWDNLQNFQYMYGQYAKRTNEDLFNQVQCLPGCISMIQIDYAFTHILSTFSYVPNETDFLRTCLQCIGTDRRFTSSILYKTDYAKILQDTRAHAYTVPPRNRIDFVNQRKRWTHNAYFNTMNNVVGNNVKFVLRFFNAIEVLKMNLIYFRLFNTIYFIYLLGSTSWPGRTLYEIVPYVVLLSWPAVCFLIYAVINSHLRQQFWKLLLFIIINKIFTMLSTFFIFSVMLFNIGVFKWSS